MTHLLQKIKEPATMEVISYLFWGILTTVVNLVTYFLFFDLFRVDYRISNIIAWVISVLFAFLTNKYFVFHSKHINLKAYFKELFLFFFYRLLSFAIADMGLLILLVQFLQIPNWMAKLATQVFVVVANYFFSKFLIFAHPKKEKKVND